MKKKVLHISTYYPPKFGGIESVARDVVRSLEKDYINIVICFNNGIKSFFEYYENILIYRIGVIFKLNSQALSLKYFFVLRKIIKKESPEFIHLHMPNPLIYLFIFFIRPKSKLILHWHSDIIEQKFMYFFVKPLEKWIINRASKILFTSNKYQKNSVPTSNYLDKSTVIPLCINKERFEKFIFKKENIQNKKLNVLFVGRLVKYKGISLLIDVAKLDTKKEFNFIICGDGPLKKKLVNKAKGLQNFLFKGKVSEEELFKAFSNSDIYAFPSITKNEAFGIAMAEAMYFGLPPICFDIPGSGVSEVNINHKTGLVISEIDPNSFYAGLLKLKDKNLRNRFGKNSFMHARDEFDYELFKKRIKNEYEKMK